MLLRHITSSIGVPGWRHLATTSSLSSDPNSGSGMESRVGAAFVQIKAEYDVLGWEKRMSSPTRRWGRNLRAATVG